MTEAAEDGAYPLLTATLRHLGDRTTRNKMTLGGNACGVIHYREALLPFLLADAQAVVAGPAGMRMQPVENVFAGGRGPARGDLLVQLRIGSGGEFAAEPFYHRKMSHVSGVDYPLVTVAGVKTANRVRVAVSGLCAFPFRSLQMEERLNRPGLPLAERVGEAAREVPTPVLSDLLGSDAYRMHLLRLSLLEMMKKLAGGEGGGSA